MPEDIHPTNFQLQWPLFQKESKAWQGYSFNEKINCKTKISYKKQKIKKKIRKPLNKGKKEKDKKTLCQVFLAKGFIKQKLEKTTKQR